MDQIIKAVQSDKKTPSIASEDSNPPVTDQLRPAEGTCTRSKTNKSDKEEKGKGFVDRVKGVVEALQPPPPMVKPVSSATVHSKFAIGDHVVLQPVDSAPIRGIVRWVGPVRTSKETGGIVIPVVGVETVSNGYYWYSYCIINVCICYYRIEHLIMRDVSLMVLALVLLVAMVRSCSR